MRAILLFSIWVLFGQSAVFSQHTIILYDHGTYGFDYSDIKEIKWKAERSFQIVIKQSQDVDLLKNISVEVNRTIGEKLTEALAIRKSGVSIDSLPLDSFKLQPFDAVLAEYVCRFSELQVGDTIEVRYTVLSDPGPGIVRWHIQHAYPVALSTFQFIVPEVTVYNDHITDYQYLVTETLLDTTFVLDRTRIPSKGMKYIFKDIPAYVEEPFAPDLNETRPVALFSIVDLLMGNVEIFMPSWSTQVVDLNVGDYFGKQYRVRSSYRWLAEQAVDILTTKYTAELMQLKLYEFIHSEFQWDGTYGLFPSHTLNEMQQSKSVNKASMNMALLALLQEAGFKAYPILVTTTDQPFVYDQIANINQFNHFVIGIEEGKKIIYMDAGDPLLPPGLVDSGVRHTRAILVKNYKGAWHEIPDIPSKSIILVDMKIHSDLSASGTIAASFEGYDAHNERHFLASDALAYYWKERASAISPGIRIDSVRFENVRNLLLPFLNKVYFHIEPSEDQEEMAFLPVFYSFFNQDYLTDSSRLNRIIFPAKLSEQAIFNITFESGLQVESLPDEMRLRMIDSSSEMDFRHSIQPSKVQCTFSISLDKRIIEPVYYDPLKEYLQQLTDILSQPVVIAKR